MEEEVTKKSPKSGSSTTQNKYIIEQSVFKNQAKEVVQEAKQIEGEEDEFQGQEEGEAE